jgi:hypothetical protein
MTGGKYSGFPRAWAVQPLPFPGIRSGLINWTPLRPALRVLKVLLDLQHVLLCPYLEYAPLLPNEARHRHLLQRHEGRAVRPQSPGRNDMEKPRMDGGAAHAAK